MILNFEVNIKRGDRFKGNYCRTVFELKDIQTHETVNKRKKSLQEPLFTFMYIDTPKTFVCRLQDVKRALIFKAWEKIEKEPQD